MDKTEQVAAAADAFNQAEQGFGVALDPDLAEGMGAFTEDALTLEAVMDDALLAAQGGMTYIFSSIYEIRRNGNVFPEKFSRWEHEFFEYFAWRKY